VGIALFLHSQQIDSRSKQQQATYPPSQIEKTYVFNPPSQIEKLNHSNPYLFS
jgi:hypothetical protein